MPPSVRISASQVSGIAGGNASFVCTVEASPTPNITWLVNGTVVDVDSEGSVTNTTSGTMTNSTLTLTLLDFNDTGNYSCMASNFLVELRSDTSEEETLSVLCKCSQQDTSNEFYMIEGICANHFRSSQCQSQRVP